MKVTRNTSKRKRHSTSFFKLVLSSSQSNKLRIPKTFSRGILRNNISSSAILKVPTGETRKVAVVKEGNELWFRDGWEDFYEHFAIDYDYFLVFEYEGKSIFSVHAFDLSACEISYDQSIKRNTSKVHYEQHCHNVNDDEKPKILHKPSVRLNESDVDVIRVESDDDDEKNDVKECNPVRYPVWLNRYEGLMQAVISAGITLPNNPFFVADIKQYVLHRGNYLRVPTPFGRQYLGNQTKFVKLEAYDGRRWKVNCVIQDTIHLKYCFYGGFMSFAQTIGLQVGDVCVFELIDWKKYVFKVHVAKSSEIKVDEQLNIVLEE